MLQLDLNPEPRWIDLGHGVRVEVTPFDSQRQLEVGDEMRKRFPDAETDGDGGAYDSARRLAFAQAAARS